jgi:hypothetical protein
MGPKIMIVSASKKVLKITNFVLNYLVKFFQSCKTALLHCMYKVVFHNIATLPFSFFRKNLNKLNHLKKIILKNGLEQA